MHFNSYDEKNLNQQKRYIEGDKKKGKDPRPLFTHYLMADNNAAKRIAIAQQYYTKNDKP
jgi:hypothetical protein